MDIGTRVKCRPFLDQEIEVTGEVTACDGEWWIIRVSKCDGTDADFSGAEVAVHLEDLTDLTPCTHACEPSPANTRPSSRHYLDCPGLEGDPAVSDTYPGTILLKRLCYNCEKQIETLDDLYVDTDSNCCVCTECALKAHDSYESNLEWSLAIQPAARFNPQDINDIEEG